MSSLGEMLRTQREKLHHSQHALAELARVAQSTISRLEANKHIPGAATLLRIAQALQFTPRQQTQLLTLAGTLRSAQEGDR